MSKIRVGDRLLGTWEVVAMHPGGMGMVLALRDADGRRAAAKTVRDEFLGEANVLRRFSVELQTWIALGRHPNLVEARDTFEVDGRPFLMLEFVEGLTLAELLQGEAPLLPAEALDYALGLCRGMQHAESSRLSAGARGLVHRDLKPSNLFVTPSRRCKVSDFGIVKVFGLRHTLTDEGMGLGTPWYVSPEQLRDARSTDGRGDIYSAAAMLYEALVGEPPLRAETMENQVYNILRVPPPSPVDRNPAVTKELGDLVVQCLDKNRENRPPNFAALSVTLARLLRSEARRPLPAGATLCDRCGHVSPRGRATCPLDGEPLRATGPEDRYRPVEDPGPATGVLSATEILDVELRIDGVELRPRVPRTGQPVTVSVLVSNPGVAAAAGCVVPFTLPDPDAFLRRGPAEFWRGEIRPTPAGAPKRVAYEFVPLREGPFTLPPARVIYRDGAGRRREARAEVALPFEVEFHSLLPLAGRERETATARDALDAALARVPFPVIFYGDPGTGKTRLLEEIAAAATARGFRVLRGKGLERAGQPMRSLHQALGGYFGTADAALRREEITARVVDGLDPLFGRDPDMAAFLAGFLAGGVPSSPQADYLWMRFFGGASRQEPLALLLDDVHWGEFETMDLVAELALRAREEGWPVAIFLACRPGDADDRASLRISHLRGTAERLRAGGGLREHDLRPLETEDVRELLDAAFPGNAFDTDAPFLAGAVREQTGGNPYFVTETFALLRQARGGDGEPLVTPAPGGWNVSAQLTPEALAEVVPDALEGAAEGHIAGLAPATLEVLERASVIGDEFDVDLLCEVAGGAGAVEPVLEELERMGLVEATDGTLSRYRFVHSILPHVVERRVAARSPRRLRRLHGEVADALVRLHGERGARRMLLRLSRHLLQAGRNRDAFRALVHAAKRLVRGQLFPRAASTLAHAQGLLDGGLKPTRGLLRDFHLSRGEAARILGRYDEAAEAYRSAIELASSSGSKSDREILGLAYSKLGKVHEARAEWTDALYCYGVGMGIREESGDRTGLASSLVNIGTTYALSGAAPRAREYLERALHLAREVHNRTARAHAKIQLGGLDLREGRLAEAARWYGRGHALFRALGDRRGQALALNGLGNVAARTGDLPRAEKAYRRSLELRRSIGEREGMAGSYNNLGIVAQRNGDASQAVVWYRRALALYREVGSRRGTAVASQNLGEGLLRLGDPTAAEDPLRESVAAWKAIEDPSSRSGALLILARVLDALERPAEAAALVGEAVMEAEAAGSPAVRAVARAARAGRLVRAGRFREARGLLEGISHEGLTPEGAAELLLVRLEALAGDGDSTAAERDTARAAAAAAVKGAQAWEGSEEFDVRLHLLEGRCAERDGRAADAVEAYRAAVAAAGDRTAPLVDALAALASAVPGTEEGDDALARLRELGEERRVVRRG